MRSLFTVRHVVSFEDGEGVSLVKTIRDLFTESERRMGQLFDDLNAKLQAEHAEVKTLVQDAIAKVAAKDAVIVDLTSQLAAAKADAISPEEKATLTDGINSFSDDVSILDPTDPTVVPAPEPVPA